MQSISFCNGNCENCPVSRAVFFTENSNIQRQVEITDESIIEKENNNLPSVIDLDDEIFVNVTKKKGNLIGRVIGGRK